MGLQKVGTEVIRKANKLLASISKDMKIKMESFDATL